jgi:hypothetical protein
MQTGAMLPFFWTLTAVLTCGQGLAGSGEVDG